MRRPRRHRLRPWHAALAVVAIGAAAWVAATRPFATHVFLPDPPPAGGGAYGYAVPLDPESPWPKFRANAVQNGRSRLVPGVDPSLRPWVFQTGGAVFSSPVVDGEGTVYVGSADGSFYAIGADGALRWRFASGGVIDSAALLDDRGRVYFGSGDARVRCLDRASGRLFWTFVADSVEEVERRHGIESYNVDWFEGNIGMLGDGTLIAPNDNFLIYAIDRDTGEKKAEYLGNELMWSLPAVNPRTRRMFAGSQYLALRNVYAFDTQTGRTVWTNGGLGSNAASPLLSSTAPNGALVLGGFDGYVRAYAQDGGRQLWARATRDHIYASPAQLSDGTIIQASTDGTVYALDPATGEPKWAYDTLGPIRSSPAVDGRDRIYVGNGEGRLFSIEPDGRLRWSHLCSDGERNDLNASPALGERGVYVGSEDGGIHFVPYDYPLTEAGRRDPRSAVGPGEALPSEGAFLIYTAPFGGLLSDPPRTIAANQPLAFTLFVREGGDTSKAAIDRDSLLVTVSGAPATRLEVSADGQFLLLVPQETWTGPAGGTLRVDVKGDYDTGMWRLGLRSFGGRRGGSFDQGFRFEVEPRAAAASPYEVPREPGDAGSLFELSRFAAPNPTILPSWNQIGFASLHYLAGIVEGTRDRAILWVIAGRRADGETVVDPGMDMRFPLVMDYDAGLLTLHNYAGFEIDFVGSWDMPFGFYRISTRVDPATGRGLEPAALAAVALGDEVAHYGIFLKLMGISELLTGHIATFGGLDVDLHPRGRSAATQGVGSVRFSRDANSATATIVGGALGVADHVYSLLLVDPVSGRPLPLDYAKRTKVEADAKGVVTAVHVGFEPGEVPRALRAWYLVDTAAAAKGAL
jgi:outer membrane protein assembly factor BamB